LRSLHGRHISTPDGFRSLSSLDSIITTVEMESNVVWSERFTLNLPPEISRDKSELDYLRRTNMEAWAAAPKPRLRPAKGRKLRPIIIVRPILVAWAAEIFGNPITATEKADDEVRELELHTPEEARRDSGVGIDGEDEMSVDLQNRNLLAEDCQHCRRDSGISMDDENEKLHQHLGLAAACCCDGNQPTGEEALYFEDDKNRPFPIHEAMVGLAI
jgi:hypothetical protein